MGDLLDDMFDLAALIAEVKHHPGMHNQANHGHRYHIDASTGKRVLKPKVEKPTKKPKQPKEVSSNMLKEPSAPPAEKGAYFKLSDEGRNDYLTTAYDGWKKELSKEQRGAVRRYTGSAYSAMNSVLRTYDSIDYALDKTKENIIAATQGLMTGVAPEHFSISRGIYGGSSQHIEDLWTTAHDPHNYGKTYIEKGFSSCTSQSEPDFGGYDNNKIVLHISVPKGSKGGGYVEPFSASPGENEFLLPPYSQFKITGSRHNASGKREMWVEYQGANPPFYQG